MNLSLHISNTLRDLHLFSMTIPRWLLWITNITDFEFAKIFQLLVLLAHFLRYIRRRKTCRAPDFLWYSLKLLPWEPLAGCHNVDMLPAPYFENVNIERNARIRFITSALWQDFRLFFLRKNECVWIHSVTIRYWKYNLIRLSEYGSMFWIWSNVLFNKVYNFSLTWFHCLVTLFLIIKSSAICQNPGGCFFTSASWQALGTTRFPETGSLRDGLMKSVQR